VIDLSTADSLHAPAALVVWIRLAEVRRIAPEFPGQIAPQHLGDPLGASMVRGGEKDHHPRAPIVVGGHLAVEAEHLGARPDQAGGKGESPGQKRLHDVFKEVAREFHSRNECDHRGES